MNMPRAWLHLLLPLGFSLAVWVSRRALVRLETSSWPGEDAVVTLFGFPYGYMHHGLASSGEQAVFVLPLLGNTLLYMGALAVLLWVFRRHLPRPPRWFQGLTWAVGLLTLSFIVLLASIGWWRWVSPFEMTDVLRRELSLGFPADF
ncbi:hypothetical protein GCM10008019_44150 [Deinococcus soli (ex Cha et al. 2016)]|nr:hypothetical protein GCM10008019_44150 [Deinococcus soli (ex Cha et al. 2016)]